MIEHALRGLVNVMGNYEVGCGPIHLRNLFFRGQILGLEIETFRDRESRVLVLMQLMHTCRQIF
jgi:hypothetical protein